MFVPDACREESSCRDSPGLPPPLLKIPHLTPQTCPLGGIPSTSPVPKPNLKSYGYTSVPAEGTRAPNPIKSPVLSRPGEYSKNSEPSRDNDKSNLSAGGKAKTRRFSLRRESLCARNPVNFRSWLDNLDKFLVEAAAGGYVKTTTTRRPSSSTPATPSPVNQTLLGTVVNPVASGTVLAPAPSLSLAGGTITLLPHPTPTSSSSPSTRSVKSGSTPLAVPCLTGVIDLTEEEDKKPGQKTAVTSMPSVAAALCSPPSAGAIAQTPGGALLVQQPGGTPLLLQPMAGMTSTAGPLLYTSHPTSFMVQTPATTTSSVLRNPLPISTTLQQQYVVAGSAMTKPPAAAAITTPSTQGQLNQPRPRPAATNQHPAPLPDMPTNTTNAAWKKDPPKPGLKISRVKQGIVLSWNMALTDENAAVVNYQLFAYQETAAPPASNLWKKVGNVKALPLPMACTLTQFQEGNKYHFSVRAIDTHGRMGPFSEPGSIHLKGAVS